MLPDFSDSVVAHGIQQFGQETFEVELARWYTDRGIALYEARNIESAYDHFVKAATLLGADFNYRGAQHPNNGVEISMWLATISMRLNRHPEAKEHFRRALMLNLEYGVSCGGIGENIVRHGRRDEILEFFSIEKKVNPQSALATFFQEVHDRFPKFVARLNRVVKKSMEGGSAKRRLIAVLPVWGDRYVEQFLDYAIPNLLVPGNFPALSRQYDVTLAIFTTPGDRRRIRAAKSFRALARYVDPVFLEYGESLMAASAHHVARFQLFSLSHYVALECAREIDSDVVCVFPDNIVNNRFYGNLGKHLKGDVSAVACTGFRLDGSKVLPVLDREYRKAGGLINVPSAGIVRILLDNLSDSWFVDSPNFTSQPFYMCWRIGDEGILVRASHFQPYAIRARYIKGSLSPRIDPLDAVFLARHLSEPDKVFCVEDTEMCALDAGDSPMLDHKPPGKQGFDEYAFARFLHEYLTPLHRKYLKAPVRLHLGSLSSKWKRVERESARVIDRVLALIDGFDRMAPARPHWAIREDNESFGNSSTAGGQATPSGRRAGVPTRAKARRRPAAVPRKVEKTKKTETPKKAKKKAAVRRGKRPGDKARKTP